MAAYLFHPRRHTFALVNVLSDLKVTLSLLECVVGGVKSQETWFLVLAENIGLDYHVCLVPHR
jgi:hypothetical protein